MGGDDKTIQWIFPYAVFRQEHHSPQLRRQAAFLTVAYIPHLRILLLTFDLRYCLKIIGETPLD